MSTKKPNEPHDTEPGMPAIPAEAIERYRRDSSRPAASEEDFRLAMLEAAAGPSTVRCTRCGGLGYVSESRALELAGIASTMLPPAPSTGDLAGELEPTIFQDEPTRPER